MRQGVGDGQGVRSWTHPDEVGVGVAVGVDVGVCDGLIVGLTVCLGVGLAVGLAGGRPVGRVVPPAVVAAEPVDVGGENEAGSESANRFGAGVALDVGAGGSPTCPAADGWDHSRPISAAMAARDSVAPIKRAGPRPTKVLRSHLSLPSRSGGSRIGNDEPPGGVSLGAMGAAHCAPADQFRDCAAGG